MPFTPSRLASAGIAGVILAAGAVAPVAATPPQEATASFVVRAKPDKTSAKERKRVDSVKTPKLGWYKCYGTAECATVRLPLDYDKPKGATTEIAVLRIKARDQKRKIGSLFLNPGGPGGSGVDIALAAPSFLSDTLLDRFDIVGVDPRGIANSDNIKCFKSTRDQTLAYKGLNVAFPYGKGEEKAYIKSAKAVAKGCSTTGKKIAGAMSTAEVVRDMDVLRRAVGDKKLSYLGFSYGTAIGQYYANMFPDRVRAVVVDGVIDPVSWTGTKKTQNQIQDERMRSADGAYKALKEILTRCDKAGPVYCAFSDGDPVKNFEAIAAKLRKKPLVITDEWGTYTVTYADFVGGVLGALYGMYAGDSVTQISAELWQLLFASGTAKATAKAAMIKRIKDARATRPARDFPYDNGFEAFSGVMCTDGLHPKDANSWPAATVKADKRAKYFGRAWAWGSVQCARNSWTVRDEDAYTGPFTRRTAAPVLVVGSYWDPATNYVEAVSSAKLLPNSRLLSSTNFGHTAYGTGACATKAIDDYLLRGTLPAKGKVCQGDVQPFTEPLEPDEDEKRSTMRADESKQLPPVADQIPASTLNGTR
ncbi:alpha/beta hydrolase [Amorphoplanes digitatis]|uniref:Pimeloyl-ACP methyl ester carboxylesterase n=1 Tax=Actinoplanes digitatis TaxID=1868 RepID=A0A7W7I0Z6_9ACTN|nr:alpha/beta hydrolase [Actinoplanes digitatis]MBB4764355.1 pimeloyl-ACP methyl ester carboxylesterase [Actinoplanes digitatis]GID94159.1 peptidase [Actinoplanes digitatis]